MDYRGPIVIGVHSKAVVDYHMEHYGSSPCLIALVRAHLFPVALGPFYHACCIMSTFP